jgi:uncharacterized integral membrane protein
MHRHEDEPEPQPDARAGSRPPAPGGWIQSRTGVSVATLITLVAVGILIAFAVVNFRPVVVNFLLFTATTRVVTVIVVSALLGFIVGWYVGRPARDERKHLREWRRSRDR